jgi:major membrane immunogen (membrane-anchored lipoprotein)
MFKINRITALLTASVLAITSLTGCGSKDKTKVEETANTFLAIVADESDEDINNYASPEVATGDFVQLFEADALVDTLVDGFNTSELTDDTKAEVDTFCGMFDKLIRSYKISSVEVGKDNTATVVATLKTKFPVEIMSSDSISAKISDATEAYYTNNEAEIAALYEQGEDVAESQIYNDMIRIIMQIYEDEILSSQETTYAINLTLEKNSDTGAWIVTSVEDYESTHAE